MTPNSDGALLTFCDPDFEERLLKRIREYGVDFDQLDDPDKAYLRDHVIKAVCPVCKKRTFEIYDAHNQRVRRYCSVVCSNLAKSKLKWECVLCHRRFKNHIGLQKHLRSEHPEFDDHEYIRLYWLHRGWDTSKLKRFCSSCSRELKLNFAQHHYRTCPCLTSEKTIAVISSKLAVETDDAMRKHYERQLRGLKSFQKRVRAQFSRTKPNVPKASPAPSQTVQSAIFECTWLDGLNESAELFGRLLELNRPVYEAYYHLLEVHTKYPKFPIHDAVIDADAALKRELASHGWGVADGISSMTSLYVLALNMAVGRDAKHEWLPYTLSTTYECSTHAQLLSSLKCDESKLAALLRSCSFPFPLVQHTHFQCWHRLSMSNNDKPAYRLNPVALLALHKSCHHS